MRHRQHNRFQSELSSELPSNLSLLDEALKNASKELPVNRFYVLILEATEQLFLSAEKYSNEGDLESVQQHTETLQKWVDDYHIGDQVMATLFLCKALCHRASDIELAAEYVERAKVVVEDSSRRHFLCQVLVTEGNIFFNEDPDRAIEAYINCTKFCEKYSLHHIKRLEEQVTSSLKMCLIIANYRLALLERSGTKNQRIILDYLRASLKVAAGLFGEDSPFCVKLQQRCRQEELPRRRVEKIRVLPQETPTVVTLYDGEIAALDDGKYRSTVPANILYRPTQAELFIEAKREKGDRTETMQLIYKKKVPQECYNALGKDVRWVSVVDNKISIADKALNRILSGEKTQLRNFLKVIERNQVISDGNLLDNSDNQEDDSGNELQLLNGMRAQFSSIRRI